MALLLQDLCSLLQNHRTKSKARKDVSHTIELLQYAIKFVEEGAGREIVVHFGGSDGSRVDNKSCCLALVLRITEETWVFGIGFHIEFRIRSSIKCSVKSRIAIRFRLPIIVRRDDGSLRFILVGFVVDCCLYSP